MAKVYMVTSGEYSDFRVEALYSNLDAAVGHIGSREDCRIEEWNVLDSSGPNHETEPAARRDLYIASIHTDDGEISLNNSPRYLDGAPADSSGLCVVVKPYNHFQHIIVGSPVSVAHAVKVAVEKRQEWLRTRDLAKAETDA